MRSCQHTSEVVPAACPASQHCCCCLLLQFFDAGNTSPLLRHLLGSGQLAVRGRKAVVPGCGWVSQRGVCLSVCVMSALVRLHPHSSSSLHALSVCLLPSPRPVPLSLSVCVLANPLSVFSVLNQGALKFVSLCHCCCLCA